MDIKEFKLFRKKLLLMAKASNDYERSILYRLYSEILYAEYKIMNYHFDQFISAENFIFNDIRENCNEND